MSKANKSTLELILRSTGHEITPEHMFAKPRRWRFDYAIPSLKVAVEYQGHGSTGKTGHVGRHASIKGMTGDCEKMNAAQSLGWRVLSFTALHFCPRKRELHKLTSPHDAITALLNP